MNAHSQIYSKTRSTELAKDIYELIQKAEKKNVSLFGSFFHVYLGIDEYAVTIGFTNDIEYENIHDDYGWAISEQLCAGEIAKQLNRMYLQFDEEIDSEQT